MSDPILSEIESVKTIIFRACSAWETQTGRKLGDEASILEFLRALQANDLLRNEDLETAHKVRAALAGLDLSTGASLPGILSGLGIPGEAQQLFLTTLQNSAQRETRIKDAFAAASPAETAKALEAITTREYPLSIYEQFLKGLLSIIGTCFPDSLRLSRESATFHRGEPESTGEANPGKTVYTFIILIAIVIAILAFIALGPVIRSMFATYKGVSPEAR